MANAYGARGVTTLRSAMSAIALLTLVACARGTPPARSQATPAALVAHPTDKLTAASLISDDVVHREIRAPPRGCFVAHPEFLRTQIIGLAPCSDYSEPVFRTRAGC